MLGISKGGDDPATLPAQLGLVRALRVTPEQEEEQADQHRGEKRVRPGCHTGLG